VDLTLKRIAYLNDETLGVLCHETLPFCITLERPWLNNQPNISCIPKSIYTCKRVVSPKFGNTFEITGVPGRYGILFHKGNISEDTQGCVILGEYFDTENNINSVKSSGEAFEEFLFRTRDVNIFRLIIQGDY